MFVSITAPMNISIGAPEARRLPGYPDILNDPKLIS
jgi:hypothetical protein